MADCYYHGQSSPGPCHECEANRAAGLPDNWRPERASSPAPTPEAPASEQHDFKEHGGTSCALVECTRCGLYAEDAFDVPCIPAATTASASDDLLQLAIEGLRICAAQPLPHGVGASVILQGIKNRLSAPAQQTERMQPSREASAVEYLMENFSIGRDLAEHHAAALARALRRAVRRPIMIQHYIEYLHPGSFVAENSAAPVGERVLPSKLPSRVAGYRFFSRTETEQDGEKLVGEKRDYTPWTYFGKAFTVDELAKEVGADSLLYGNIARNNYVGAVRTIFGNWYPLNEGERAVPLP